MWQNMDELDLCLCESASITHNTNLDKHFASNAVGHCDLFEIQLYKEFWNSLQESESTIFNSTIEQLVNSVNP